MGEQRRWRYALLIFLFIRKLFVAYLFFFYCKEKAENVQTDSDFISAKENDRLTIIGKREDSKWWVAYHNGRRGLCNLDYLDPSVVSIISKKFLNVFYFEIDLD